MVLCYLSHEMGLSHTRILSPKIGVIFLLLSRVVLTGHGTAGGKIN